MSAPTTVAQFEQARAATSFELTALVDVLHKAHAACSCGGSVDASSHLIAFIEIFEAEYKPYILATLLTEAIARLAVEGGGR